MKVDKVRLMTSGKEQKLQMLGEDGFSIVNVFRTQNPRAYFESDSESFISASETSG